MKTLVRNALRKCGVEVSRLSSDDTDVYRRWFPQKSLDDKLFFNVGAGNFSHPLWTNVDYVSDWYADNTQKTLCGISYDLFSLEPMAIEDNIAEVVYSSHTIEHIKDEHARFFFREAYRILKPGGIIRITAPDIDLHYRAYRSGDYDFYYWRSWDTKKQDYKRKALTKPLSEASISQLFLLRLATATSTLHADGTDQRITDDDLKNLFETYPYEEALSNCCERCTVGMQKKYPGNHTNWWNRDKCLRMLKQAGFHDARVSGYGQSTSPVLRNTSLFDSTHPKISLYVEATK